MKIRLTNQDPLSLDCEWLAWGVEDGQTNVPGAPSGHPISQLLNPLLVAKEVGTGVGETTPLFLPESGGYRSLLLFGLGKAETFGPRAAYGAGVAIGKRLSAKPGRRAAVVPPHPSGMDAQRRADCLTAFVEGIVVGTEGPGLRKSERSRHPIEDLVIVPAGPDSWSAGHDVEELIDRARIVGEAINLARELVNIPPGEKPPRVLAQRVTEIAEATGVQTEVWGIDRLKRERFGGLLAVAAGSAEPPAFVHLRYRGAEGDAPSLALVGKGVTFDSGGLSLKPSSSMEDMKADMAGAASVLAAIDCVAKLRLPVHVDGYLAFTENMTGGSAMKLGDVLTMRNGKTVEVLNTDAEGRLILADALSYAVEQRPGRVIDLATLTGACVVALGTKVAGLFCDDPSFTAEIEVAARRAGEHIWRLPLEDDYDDLLKSNVADMKNVGGKWGGAITAAKFLQRFVGETPWAHLDIAGPSWADAESSTQDAGATGCLVRTLVALLGSDHLR